MHCTDDRGSKCEHLVEQYEGTVQSERTRCRWEKMKSNLGGEKEEYMKSKVKDMKMAIKEEEVELKRERIRNKSRR